MLVNLPFFGGEACRIAQTALDCRKFWHGSVFFLPFRWPMLTMMGTTTFASELATDGCKLNGRRDAGLLCQADCGELRARGQSYEPRTTVNAWPRFATCLGDCSMSRIRAVE